MTALVITLIIVAFAGVAGFFVLPASIAWIGWAVFGACVVGLLVALTVSKEKL
jgi:hypothetical protein